jgi:hypothetical protein
MTNADIITVIRLIRDIGATNMFDRAKVIELAYALDFSDEAEWIATRPHEYGTLILTGKLPDEPEQNNT